MLISDMSISARVSSINETLLQSISKAVLSFFKDPRISFQVQEPERSMDLVTSLEILRDVGMEHEV